MKKKYENKDSNAHESSPSSLNNGKEEYNNVSSSNVTSSIPLSIDIPEPSIYNKVMTDEETELVTILNKVTTDLTTVSEEESRDNFTKAGLYLFMSGFLFPFLWFIGSFIPKKCNGDKRMERWRLMNRISALIFGFIVTTSAIVLVCLHALLK